MASHTRLKLDKNLLNPKFESYKLSLDSLPVYRQSLPKDVMQICPDDQQYSLQHVKMFNLHNHLHRDPWDTNSMYYVDTNKAVVCSKFDENARFKDFEKVFELPQRSQPMQYNISMCFSSNHHVVIADGSGMLFVIETGNRLTNAEWKVCFSGSSEDIRSPFILLQAMTRSEKEISCLLLSVEERKTFEYPLDVTGPFVTVLLWVDLISDEFHEWSIQHVRKLAGSGSIEYASLSPEKSILYLASSSPFKFVYDSLSAVDLSTDSLTEKNDIAPLYAWMQKGEDLTAIFKLPKGVKKDDVMVEFHPDSLKLTLRNHSLSLSGKLFANIDVDASTWILEDEKLEISLCKLDEQLVWQDLIIGDNRGKEIIDLSLLDDVHKRLEHLTSENSPMIDNTPAFNPQQLEECDVYPTDYFALYIMDGESFDVKEQINLSGNQWLFNVMLKPALPLAFCIRHDVDGIVWQPTNERKFQHEITFNAFGYVQASKQDRKFSNCSPDGSFAVISDIRKHLYVYHQPSPLSSSLKNRRTNCEIDSISRQQVVSLDSTDDIMGVQITGEIIFALTKNDLFAVRVKIV